MYGIVEYTKEHLKTFEEEPFNDVDSAVLSWLAYVEFPQELSGMFDWSGTCLRELFRAEYFNDMMKVTNAPVRTLALLIAAAASPRFRDIKITGFVNDFDMNKEKQFAAVTFQLGNGSNYVAFRGTDFTFIGWKEDFNMSLENPIPSQVVALNYLEKAASELSGSLILGGHSKGGNLAVYAASMCGEELQQRITKVYSFDGPGFKSEFIEREGFKKIQPLICKTLPQSSLIGMVFEQECEYKIVKSKDFSVGQHNMLTWYVEGDRFVYADDLTPDAKFLYRSVNKWIFELDDVERGKFINALFGLLEKTKASDFIELGKNAKQNVTIIAKEIIDLDRPTKKLFLKVLSLFAASGVKSISEAIDRRIQQAKLNYEIMKSSGGNVSDDDDFSDISEIIDVELSDDEDETVATFTGSSNDEDII